MDREAARKEIRQRVDCRKYLEKSKSGLYCCPFCGSGHGKNATGAVKYYPDTNTICCFGGCGGDSGGKGKKYDVIDLYQQETGADYNTALSLLADEIGITIDPYKPDASADFRTPPQTAQTASQGKGNEQGNINAPAADKSPQTGAGATAETPADYTAYYAECRERLKDPAAVAYLNSRGISIETAAAYWIGYDPAADPAQSNHPCPRLIIPTSKTHYVGRRIDGGKDFAKLNAKGSSPAIFNRKALYAQNVQEVFVTEGAFDALSLLEAGYTAIALNSAANAEALITQLEKQRTAATLILCPDNDSDPKTAEKVKKEFGTLAAGLQRLNISHITANICAGCNDPNEALTTDRAAFVEAIETARQQAAQKPDNVQYYIDNLMGGDIAKFKNDIKTGYSNLDAQAGGLYSGLYVVAAISSLGKTTFCHQLADQIAAGGNDVLFFSMEQSRLEMVSKSLARRTAQKDLGSAVTSLAIRKGYLPQSVKDAAKEYKEAVADRLSVIEGNFACNISFIGDYIRQYMRRNPDSRPIVFIDYLQILQPAEDATGRKQTTKETVDTTVTELKRLSREMDLTIFIISSVNRANYLTPIDFESLKESGGIEYTADVIWGLQLQCLNDPIFDKANNIKERREKVKQAKAETPRKIELVCLKNRYGIANYSCYFKYYPAADLFAEDAGAEFEPLDAPKTTGRRI